MKCSLYRVVLAAAMLINAVGAEGQVVALKAPSADEVVIGNPLVSRDADNIIVDYDLLMGELVSSCSIELQVSTDAGVTFTEISEGVTGDIRGIASSGHKMIKIPFLLYRNMFTGKSLAFNLVVADKSTMKFKLSPAENLSTRGTANCYIVSKSGVYSFKAVKGNSHQSIGNVAGVEVLWETFGTSVTPMVGELVQSVQYDSGYVYFKIADVYREGNALIAAKDASGKILWSWHIWLTDQPGKCVYANNAGTMMDRNLGATSATPGEVGALGLLYQWGRKDPFLGSSSISNSVESQSTGKFDFTKSKKATGTITYATEHPTTFITYNTNNYDWYYSGRSSTDNTRWQSTKTIYDPCPAGWRVPDGGSNGVWNKAGFKDQSYDSSDEGLLFGSGISSPATWYPAAGCRYRNVVALYYVGYDGLYWSVTPNGSNAYSLYFSRYGSVYPASDSTRALGQSVRCLQE